MERKLRVNEIIPCLHGSPELFIEMLSESDGVDYKLHPVVALPTEIDNRTVYFHWLENTETEEFTWCYATRVGLIFPGKENFSQHFLINAHNTDHILWTNFQKMFESATKFLKSYNFQF